MINSSKNAKQHANYLHHSTGRGLPSPLNISRTTGQAVWAPSWTPPGGPFDFPRGRHTKPVLDELAAHGLVQRRLDPDDRRLKLPTLSCRSRCCRYRRRNPFAATSSSQRSPARRSRCVGRARSSGWRRSCHAGSQGPPCQAGSPLAAEFCCRRGRRRPAVGRPPSRRRRPIGSSRPTSTASISRASCRAPRPGRGCPARTSRPTAILRR